MTRYEPKPIKTAYYASAAGGLDLVTLGGGGVPARKIRCGGAGNLIVTNDDGSEATIVAVAGQEVEGAFREVDGDSTATLLTVVWYG
jgi:hypothetical protein